MHRDVRDAPYHDIIFQIWEDRERLQDENVQLRQQLDRLGKALSEVVVAVGFCRSGDANENDHHRLTLALDEARELLKLLK
jgi:hypothetical protein